MFKIFAVAGNPVLHSRSPDIFNEAFRAMSIDAVYTRLAVSSAEEIIRSAKEIGIKGVNITSPFKEDIITCLDEIEGNAERIGAVNTVVEKRGRFKGYNTDFIGVIDALRHNEFNPKGKKAVVLGAGGAGKAAVYALMLCGARVNLINRSPEKAVKVADMLGCTTSCFEELDKSLKEADILISCVSTGERVVEPELLEKHLFVLDANYSVPTMLRKDAKARVCRIIDGQEWLMFQAIPAFRLFTGRKPPVEVIEKSLVWKIRVKKNMAFIGFMGAGKSTVAMEMAEQTHKTLVDTDKNIEKSTGLSIEKIFKDYGEGVFRRMERKEITRLNGLSDAVISFGGGIVINAKNADFIRKNCLTVWLWVDVKTALSRMHEKNTRPLLAGKSRETKAKKILASRLHLYARITDLIINTDNKSPQEIVKRVCDETGHGIKN